MFEIRVPERALDLEVPVIDEQFIAGGNIDLVIMKLDAAQAPVPAPAAEVDLRGIPVHMLESLLLLEIHGVYAAVAVALPAAAHH